MQTEGGPQERAPKQHTYCTDSAVAGRRKRCANQALQYAGYGHRNPVIFGEQHMHLVAREVRSVAT